MTQCEYVGRNHAILAENYMNVGLRLGYHYSVIDSYVIGNVNQNYVYFRFAGGFADQDHRRRRAELIRAILDQLRFKVTVKGDLVLGKLKLVDDKEVISILQGPGELTGFTRQIDLAMDSESMVEQFTEMFLEKFGCAVKSGKRSKPCPGSLLDISKITRAAAGSIMKFLEDLKVRYHTFRIIVANNEYSLDLMRSLGQSLRSGSSYLPEVAEELLSVTYELVDGLNRLSGGRHQRLFETYYSLAGYPEGT